MLGLAAYDSSSEEEVEVKAPKPTQLPKAHVVEDSQIQIKFQPPPNRIQSQPPLEAPSGPVLGPSSMHTAASPEEPSTGGRTSPFSSSRALIQDMTLPPVPNLDIPPSPPGSPDPAANAKFEHFLSLKKQGVHFNTKLASSSSLKNPSLLMKMMAHAGIDEQSQYDTSLPPDVWTTSDLPSWAVKEELFRSQQRYKRKMGEQVGQRSSVEFVSGSDAKRKGNP
ncbi:uncharacterized protein N7483_001804 [Penicillium malachiteum]|uniref:uncharacterized protein n=1 Tax=Penicillium malachiteum TaxID=1324776 RepID=UPI00254994E0|nr:uncharacterized protein N7483_001804 [Penicillium malachiteum]KAJ5736679.1 hypothetical protein N7483_001804 [Penicillium malachiteum]